MVRTAVVTTAALAAACAPGGIDTAGRPGGPLDAGGAGDPAADSTVRDVEVAPRADTANADGLVPQPWPGEADASVSGVSTGAFDVAVAHMTSAFDCAPDVWCARMGNFRAFAGPALNPNSHTYGGRTGYGPSPGNQLGLSADPGADSVVIQGGANGAGEHGLGWYYSSAREGGAWDLGTANLATGYRWSTPQALFPPAADGYGYLRFRYTVRTNNHPESHLGNRLGGWLTFVDSKTPPGGTRVIWIGVKPFDSKNPDATVAFPDSAVSSDKLAFIFRQAMQPELPRQFGYRGSWHGPFVQFESDSVRSFQSTADATWRSVRFRVYKANLQRAIDLARVMCGSSSPDPHKNCNGRTTDDWSASASDWRLADVHVNPECKRVDGLPNELGYSLKDAEGGWGN